MLRYAHNLQNDVFIVLHRGNGCRQPYDEARAKSSVDPAPWSKGGVQVRQLIPATFRTHMNRDAMVVEAAAKDGARVL